MKSRYWFRSMGMVGFMIGLIICAAVGTARQCRQKNCSSRRQRI